MAEDNANTLLEQQDSKQNITLTVSPSIVALFVVYFKTIFPLFIIRCIIVQFLPDDAAATTSTIYTFFCIIWLLEMVRRYFNHIYYFKDKEIFHVGGRISLHLYRIHIKYVDIRETRVVQSILGRMLDYGTVIAGTAATSRDELVCYKVDKPHEVANYIQEMIKKTKRELKDQADKGLID